MNWFEKFYWTTDILTYKDICYHRPNALEECPKISTQTPFMSTAFVIRGCHFCFGIATKVLDSFLWLNRTRLSLCQVIGYHVYHVFFISEQAFFEMVKVIAANETSDSDASFDNFPVTLISTTRLWIPLMKFFITFNKTLFFVQYILRGIPHSSHSL